MKIKINGKDYSADKGERLIDILLEKGFEIPHICYEKDLSPVGSCGLCLVEVKGKGIAKACEEIVEDGMEIVTDNEQIYKARKDAFIFMLHYSSHPVTCLFCDKYDECKGIDNCLKGFELKKGCKVCSKDGDCIIQKMAEKFSLLKSNIKIKEKGLKKILEPFFIRDYDYCLLCSKCIRVCYEKRLQDACFVYLDINNRPLRFQDEGCIFCGSCLDICPTGTLYSPGKEKAEEWIKSICPYCGVGCGLKLGVKGDKIVEVKGDREAINRVELCV